jgi:drug/metabolite transporter (DMT)-like permease
MNKDRLKAILYIVIAATLLSTGGIIIKFIDLPPIFSAAVVWLYVRKPKFTFSKAQVSGALCYSTMITAFVIANKLTTAANAIILQFTAPIWVAILSVWILKERIRWYDIVAIFSVAVGMVLFFLDDMSGGNWAGNMVAIGSGIALAGVTISLRFQKDEKPVETTLLGHLITAVIGIPFLIGLSYTTGDLLGLFVLGTFQVGIAYIFYSLAVKHLTALESILIMFLEPILNPIWVFLIAGERPGPISLVGGVIVLGTVIARSLLANRINQVKKYETAKN